MIPEDKREILETLPQEYSHLYMAIEGKLSAVICIEDPLRPEAADVIRELKKAGISKVVSSMQRYCQEIRQNLSRKKRQQDAK